MGVDNWRSDAHALTILYHVLQLIFCFQEERSIISSELKPLILENNQYYGVVETLQKHLGCIFRDGNNIMQAHGSVLCSAIEELDQRVFLNP